ncbi:MAG: class I adenylate cyclase [Methylothermaceae bacterium]|nr:class I adenylate cyclase [Methylothermaceae bacterium]
MPLRTHRPIRLDPPGGEISRKDLNTLIRRFLHLHRQRLQYLHAWLTPRQRDCLEILPLLLHCNHPALPGYGSGQAPAGISDYRPSSAARQAARRLASGFDYRRQGTLDPPILGLFLMGSIGSVAYSDDSDLDIWLCHRSDLDSAELDELQDKCELIESWAAEHGLEIHFFPIDPARFRQGQLGPLSPTSSGTTQHNLLLEEFYRTAVWLAGRKLLWWLVPPQQEHDYREYADYLLHRRFVDAESVIDLGGLDRVPAAEFISAGLWHLYKALDSPYKALLKLQLLLDYATAYPRPRWLAASIKSAVYAGRLDSEPIDPYLCLYRQVEQYLLTQNQPTFLPLIRRCFYIKTRSALQQPAHRAQLTALFQSWGWNPRFPLKEGENRLQRIEQAEVEWRTLNQTLENNYQLISRLASRHNPVPGREQEELRLLGRKLRAALEKRPDKVDVVQLVPEGGLPEAAFVLNREQTADGGWQWRLYRGRPPNYHPQPLHQARHLLQVIAWAQVNGVSPPASQWTPLPGPLPLDTAELRFLNHTARRYLAHRWEPSLEAYRRPARLLTAALFVNINAPARPRRSGFEIASERFDPLGYGAKRHVLIHNAEVLTQNSWGEIQVHRYEGLPGLLDCFCRLYEQGGPETEFRVHCFASRTIALRVAGLYRDLQHALRQTPKNWFVLHGGNRFYLIRSRDHRLNWVQCNDEASLLDALGQHRTDFSSVSFDAQTLTHSPLPFLYRHNRQGKVQLFLRPHGGGVEVWIIDERGALYRQDYAASAKVVWQRYAALFSALDRRYPGSGDVESAWLDGTEGKWRLRTLDILPPSAPSIEVQVYAEEIPDASPRYTVVCNGREFSSRDLGEAVFSETARYIRRLRLSGTEYPCYVSDIDVPLRVLGLSHPALFHTVRVLAYKRQVEHLLNQA